MEKSHSQSQSHYRRLAVMFALHFVAMYVLMYAMVHNLSENVYHSWNQFYMAGLMTASMSAIELALMSSMYSRRRWNAAIIVISIAALVGFWTMIRQQTAISDEQFIRSMIPHHSGAILMCQQAAVRDAELQKLCGAIVSSQQQEINQMKAILKRLD